MGLLSSVLARAQNQDDGLNLIKSLYQRVRLDNIQRNKACKEMFDSRLKKPIEASELDEMIGDWHDYGRLLDY